MQKPTYERHFKTPIGVDFSYKEIEIVKLLPQKGQGYRKGRRNRVGGSWKKQIHLTYKVLRQKKKKVGLDWVFWWLVRSHVGMNHLVFCQRWRRRNISVSKQSCLSGSDIIFRRTDSKGTASECKDAHGRARAAFQEKPKKLQHFPQFIPRRVSTGLQTLKYHLLT